MILPKVDCVDVLDPKPEEFDWEKKGNIELEDVDGWPNVEVEAACPKAGAAGFPNNWLLPVLPHGLVVFDVEVPKPTHVLFFLLRLNVIHNLLTEGSTRCRRSECIFI